MIISLFACIVYILSNLNLSFGEAFTILEQKQYTHFINTDINSKTFFLKTILGGMFITIAMTGLDQEMMQKNISVDNLKKLEKRYADVCRNAAFCESGVPVFRRSALSFAMQHGADYGQISTMVDGKEGYEYFGFKDSAGQIKI
jgi:hypothetical protein